MDVRFPALALVTTLAAPALYAQTPAANAAPTSPLPTPEIKVTLRVFAKGKGVPLGKAEVTVGSTKLVTDATGGVEISVPLTGKGTVLIHRHGYELGNIPFADLRQPGEYDAYLIPAVDDENVIVVQGERRTSVTKKTISIEEAAKVAPNGDPAQVVKLLPGVQSRGNSPEVVVWGSGPQDSKYYIDDLEVPFIFHNFGNLSVIPGNFLAAVEFESGGFGPEYGDATGGVITLRTKTEQPERPLTQFVVDLPFYSGITYEKPIGDDAALWVGLRRSYIDLFLSKYLARQNRGGGGRGNLTIAPVFGDAEAMYLKKRDDGYDKVTLLSAYDGLKAAVPTNNAQNEDGRADLDILTEFANLGVEHQQILARDWRYKTTPQIYYYNNTADFSGSSNDFTVDKVRAPTEFTRRLSKTEDLYFGLDPAWSLTKTNVYAVVPHRDDPTWDPQDASKVKTADDEVGTNVAGWAAIDQTLGPVTLTPGARGFYDSQIKKSSGDPRLKAKLPLGEDHTLKAAIGQYSESPTAGEASPTRGNPELGYIRSHHYVIGLETNWNDSWTSEVQTYYKTATGLVESDPETIFTNSGELRSQGATLFIRRNMTGRLFGWLSYTYSKSQQRTNEQSPWHQSQYDQTNVVNLVGDYRFTGTWDLGGRFYYHTGDTYSTVSDSVFDVDLDKYEQRPAAGDRDAGRMPDFDALDLYLTHDVLYDTWKLSWRFGVMSWWPRPEVQMVRYNYDYTKTEQVTALRSIPFIELRGEI